MLHNLIAWYFQQTLELGYVGVAAMMALESTIVPIPSEVIIPPAAYWASQGKMSYAGVVLAGTIGSVVGAVVMYLASKYLGRPLLMRYGKYVRITPDKIEASERFVARYQTGGIFFARLLPVVRHLIGIPAGLVRMPLGSYVLMTAIGSALWCTVLTWFGAVVLGDQPDLIGDPDAVLKILKAKSLVIGAGVLVLAVAYVLVVRMTRKDAQPPA
jgi:membrane protein DedA with SNARE-associated domain